MSSLKMTKGEILDMFVQSAPALRVKELTEALGIRYEEESMGAYESACLMYNFDSGKYTIRVNKDHPEVRQRFSIAHELGHYFMHKDLIGPDGVYDEPLWRRETMDRLPPEVQQRESEANRFASAILMPDDALKSYLASRDKSSIYDLAKEFVVSREAMSIRLKSFKKRHSVFANKIVDIA